ncbi:MAG: penicillin-binding protein [Kordia sp.]|nr:MAG: penicillin-binding protein [Kordia sp.]
MFKRIVIFFLRLSLLVTLLILIFITAVNYDVFGHINTKEELKKFSNETASVVLSDNNTVIGKYFSQNRTNTSYKELPKHLVDALIATEDSRYFEHSGVDAKSLFRVLFKTILLSNKRSGGGSTITQQLAKNMYGRPNYGPLTMLINKTKEGIQAYRIEQTFNKEEILTLYLNTVSFGENVYGIESAALRYFNKKIAKLTIEESAVLVGLLKANTFYNPRLHPDNALRRRNTVLFQMKKESYLTTIEYDSLNKLPLQLNYTNLAITNKAGYFLTMVKKETTSILDIINKKSIKKWNIEKDGLHIETTLDITLQEYALDAFASHLSKMQQQFREHYKNTTRKKELKKLVNKQLRKLNLYGNKLDRSKQLIFDWKGNYTDSINIADSLALEATILHAGMLAINPTTGAIKTWVGGINHNSYPYDQIFAQRQLASTFKPILYAAALEEGRQPCAYLDNEQLTISDYNNWSPENANKKTGGKYSMTGALMNSMNIPTVNLFMETGFKPIDSLWQQMQFSTKLENTPSLALGTANASIYEVTRAYATFANGGNLVNPKCITKITTADGEVLYQDENIAPKQILKERTSKLINTTLQRAINEGTGTSLRNTYNVTLPLAGKTGTSQNYADAWFVGYNPNLVLVSRVGCASPKIHFYNGTGSGGRLALPLVAKTLYKVQNNSKLKKRYSKEFPYLSEKLLNELACEDFKEKTGLENFFNLFKRKDKNFDKEQGKWERKKNKESFFKKLFKKKNNR